MLYIIYIYNIYLNIFVLIQKGTGYDKIFISIFYNIGNHGFTALKSCPISLDGRQNNNIKKNVINNIIDNESNTNYSDCDSDIVIEHKQRENEYESDNELENLDLTDLSIKKIKEIRKKYIEIKLKILKELKKYGLNFNDETSEIQFVNYKIGKNSASVNEDKINEIRNMYGYINKNNNVDSNVNTNINNNNNNNKKTFFKIKNLKDIFKEKMPNHKDSAKIVQKNGSICTITFSSSNVIKCIYCCGANFIGHCLIGIFYICILIFIDIFLFLYFT